MSSLHYQNDVLMIENVNLNAIAEKYGTPCYVYSRAALEKNWHLFNNAFTNIPHRLCYAVKANSNINILRLFANLGSGFDIVSGGELARVIAANGDPQKIIFSGVGKSQWEIEEAISKNIFCFDVESKAELERLQATALKLNKTINIALRINPNIDPGTHSYISTGLNENKFGIDAEDVIPLSQSIIAEMPNLQLIGIASHIGSQIVELTPFLLMIDRLLKVYQQLQTLGITLSHINIGGGLGINYRDEQPPAIQDYVNALQKKIANYPIEVIIEPGRAIVGNAGILLTRVEYLKHTPHKNFAIVDAGMNDLIRPALYGAWQNILPVNIHYGETKLYDIAGPVCESSDFLGKDRTLALNGHDLLAVDAAGAYGFSMSSNYNSRCRAAEVLVNGDQFEMIRRRETLTELFAAENM